MMSSSFKSSTLKLNSSPQQGERVFLSTVVVNFCFPSLSFTYASLNPPLESVGGMFLASITRTRSCIVVIGFFWMILDSSG